MRHQFVQTYNLTKLIMFELMLLTKMLIIKWSGIKNIKYIALFNQQEIVKSRRAT